MFVLVSLSIVRVLFLYLCACLVSVHCLVRVFVCLLACLFVCLFLCLDHSISFFHRSSYSMFKSYMLSIRSWL